MKSRLFFEDVCLTLFLCGNLRAQDQAIFAPAMKSKFVNFPGLACVHEGLGPKWRSVKGSVGYLGQRISRMPNPLALAYGHRTTNDGFR
jgi:hypothetical protein